MLKPQLQYIQDAKNTRDTEMNVSGIVERLPRLQWATNTVLSVAENTSRLINSLSTPLQIDEDLIDSVDKTLKSLETIKSDINKYKNDAERHKDLLWWTNFDSSHLDTQITQQETLIKTITNANNAIITALQNNQNKKWNTLVNRDQLVPLVEKKASLENEKLQKGQEHSTAKNYADTTNTNHIDHAITQLTEIRSAINLFETSPLWWAIEINTDDTTSTINLEKGTKSPFGLAKNLQLSALGINWQYLPNDPDTGETDIWKMRTRAKLKDGTDKDVIIIIKWRQHNLKNIPLSDIKVFDPSIKQGTTIKELSKDTYPLEFSFDITTTAEKEITETLALNNKKRLRLESTMTIPLRLTCESLDKNGKKSAIHDQFTDTTVHGTPSATTLDHTNSLLATSIKPDKTTADNIESAVDRYFKDASGNSLERKWVFDKKLLTGFIWQHLIDDSGTHWIVDRVVALVTTGSNFKKNPLLYSNDDTANTLDNRFSHLGKLIPGYTGGGTATFRAKFAEYITDLRNGTHISDPAWTEFFASEKMRDVIFASIAGSDDSFDLKRNRDPATIIQPQNKKFLDHYNDFATYVNTTYPKPVEYHNISLSDAYSEHLQKLASPLTTSLSGKVADGKKYTMKLTSSYDKTSKTYKGTVELTIDKVVVGTPSPYEIANAYNYKDIMRGVYDLCNDIEAKRWDKSLKPYAWHINSVGAQLCLNTIADCIGVGSSQQQFSNAGGITNGTIKLTKNASDTSAMKLHITGTNPYDTAENKKIDSSDINNAVKSMDVFLATRRLAQREAIEGTASTKPMLIPDAMKEQITPITENYSIFVNKYGEGTWIRKTANPDEYECRDTRKRPPQRWPFRTGEWMEGRQDVAQSHEKATATHQPLVTQGKNTRNHWVYDFKELGQSFVDGGKSAIALTYRWPSNTFKSMKWILTGNKNPSTIPGVEDKTTEFTGIGTKHDNKTVRYEYINAVSTEIKDNITTMYLDQNWRSIGKMVYDLKGVMLKSHGDETLMKKKITNILSERTGYSDITAKTDELYTLLSDNSSDPEYISSQLQKIIIEGITSTDKCKDFVKSKTEKVSNILWSTRWNNDKRKSKLRSMLNSMYTRNTWSQWVWYARSFVCLQTINIVSTVKALVETGKLAWRIWDTTIKHWTTIVKTTSQLTWWIANLAGRKTLWRESANEQYTIANLLKTIPPEAQSEFEKLNIHSAPDREYHILQQWFNSQRSHLADQREDSTKELNKEYYYSGDVEKLHEWGIAINIPINGVNTTFAMHRDTSGAMILHKLSNTPLDTFTTASVANSRDESILKSFIRNMRIAWHPNLYANWNQDGDPTTTKNTITSWDKQVSNINDLSTSQEKKCKISDAILNQLDYQKKTHNGWLIQESLRIDAGGNLSGDQTLIDLYKNDRRIISWFSEAINYFYPANTNKDLRNTVRAWNRANSAVSETGSSLKNLMRKAFSKKTFKFGNKL